MISYKESLKILEEAACRDRDEDCEEVELLRSVDRLLAEDLKARENNPYFDNSAMDGFAVNAAATEAHLNLSNEWIPVQSVIAAGDTNFKVERLEDAVEIMTGAPIPHPYFDSVVRIEDVQVITNLQGQKMIRINSAPVPGSNIRRAGEDTKAGDVLLCKGVRISCEHLLVLATQGISRLKVKKKIRISILSTGKEIVDYATKELKFAQIRNSTGVYLEASLASPLCNVKNYGIVQDEPSAYVEHIKKLLHEDSDLIISTGAVSMGMYDFVRPALESIGAKIHFHKCSIRPGKPILFASIVYKNKTRFIFGLPGNPVSTMVGLRFFIKPFINLLLKIKTVKPLMATLVSDTKKPEGFKCFFKAKVSLEGPEAKVEILKGQASFMVSPLLQSNAWVVFPEEGTLVKSGTSVEVFAL